MDKYRLFPLKHMRIWNAFKMQEQAIWTADEIDFSQDRSGFENLNVEEKHLISCILGFFAHAEGVIQENSIQRLFIEIEIPEARCFYALQAYNEVVHAETYGKLIQAYFDEQEAAQIFDLVRRNPAIDVKMAWAKRWLEDDCTVAQRLFSFSVIEGLFFASSFCSIYYFRHKNKLPALTTANDLIARDESMHTCFGALMYQELGLSLNYTEAVEAIEQAVDAEIRFACSSIEFSELGFSAESMAQYVKYVADSILELYGLEGIYGVSNPFDYMVLIDVLSKNSFFEKQVTDYRILGNEELIFN